MIFLVLKSEDAAFNLQPGSVDQQPAALAMPAYIFKNGDYRQFAAKKLGIADVEDYSNMDLAAKLWGQCHLTVLQVVTL